MEDENGMIPMGRDEVGIADSPPTAKERTATQQEVNRLLDALAPERAAHHGGAPRAVERHRTPRGCILQAPAGAVTVSWFADSAQGAELGELQVVAWHGTVTRPGSSQRVAGARIERELVLRPVDSRMGGLEWRATDGTAFTSEALAAYCMNLLEQWTVESGSDAPVSD